MKYFNPTGTELCTRSTLVRSQMQRLFVELKTPKMPGWPRSCDLEIYSLSERAIDRRLRGIDANHSSLPCAGNLRAGNTILAPSHLSGSYFRRGRACRRHPPEPAP